jgi:transposase
MMDKLPNLTRLSSEEKDELIQVLWFQNAELRKQVEELVARCQGLEAQVKELENRLSKDSRTSHKPPSSDGYKTGVMKSHGSRSGRKPGGQEGHEGTTLLSVREPDEVEWYEVKQVHCERCGHRLEDDVGYWSYEERQVIDIPLMKPHVKSHRSEMLCCWRCGHENKAGFPAGVGLGAVQYGARVKGLATYFNQYQLIPYDRLQGIFQDVYQLSLSQGTLVGFDEKCYEGLGEFEGLVKGYLKGSEVANFDESGLRVGKQLQWLHVASTGEVTHYAVHAKRGQKAMSEIGILPDFKGRAIHDHWGAYFRYLCDHSLCNAHHLRELTYLHERYQQAWCFQMKACLLSIKATVDDAKAKGQTQLTPPQLHVLERWYDRILEEGLDEIPIVTSKTSSRGRAKQHPAKNLWDRLRVHKPDILAFMKDFAIPFDNNQAERDIRMVKVKQKISGCFRSQAGSHRFCRIRGYVSTARKHTVNALTALIQVFEGQPFIPDLIRPTLDSS